ncbi:MAG: hypothetical protein Q8S21_02060 [Candidatus Paracaedibacteraceae bacterium]|nr:hypothetical protein [Candidatus Paracaedibacteraceae bacterium]
MQVTGETTNTMLSALENTLIFGGVGGQFNPIQDIGSQIIIFKSGDVLDSIQIGAALYGGSGGLETARAQLPSNGRIDLRRLQSGYKDGVPVISYFEALINNVLVESGVLRLDNPHYTTFDAAHLSVYLSGINDGDYINNLQFTLVA